MTDQDKPQVDLLGLKAEVEALGRQTSMDTISEDAESLKIGLYPNDFSDCFLVRREGTVDFPETIYSDYSDQWDIVRTIDRYVSVIREPTELETKYFEAWITIVHFLGNIMIPDDVKDALELLDESVE